MLYRVLASLPGVALSLVWLHHVIDMALVEKEDLSRMQHPWMVFAAVVSLALFLLHTTMFLLLTCKCYRFLKRSSVVRFVRRYFPTMTYVQVEFFIVMVDLTWSGMWLLQLGVQALLTPRHRLYKPATIYFLLVLYACQVVLTIPLGVHLYHKQP